MVKCFFYTAIMYDTNEKFDNELLSQLLFYLPSFDFVNSLMY